MNSSFVIEKNVPVSKACVGRPRKFPFHIMKKGDSFLIPVKRSDKRRANLYRTAALISAKHLNVKATTRTVSEGIRVWRML